MNTLTLKQQIRQGGGGRTHRDWVDVVVDDRPLHSVINPGDFIGCIGWLPAKAEASLVRQLLMKEPSELGESRCQLYMCPECGDIGCGAVTVVVEKTSDAFTWSQFRFENNYDEGMTTPFESVGPYQFAKHDYWKLLSDRLGSREA